MEEDLAIHSFKLIWIIIVSVFFSSHAFGVTLQSAHLATIEKNLNQQVKCPHGDQITKIGIRIHVSLDAKRALEEESQWLTLQLNTANQLFQSIKVCFQVQKVMALSPKHLIMKTRKQRTSLGRTQGALLRGSIDLFIVSQLNDVDRIGEVIRGVHWRDPKDRKFKRWIILSRIARAQVLAHELGHYFSLPHSKYAKSIMNKTPRKKPPYDQRGFVKAEIKQMKRAKSKMLQQKYLIAL